MKYNSNVRIYKVRKFKSSELRTYVLQKGMKASKKGFEGTEVGEPSPFVQASK